VKALVYGLARSGRAAAERLEERGEEVVLVDRSLGNETELSLLEGVELLVKSPGVPGEAPLLAEARARGIPVWSELELGWSLLAPTGTRFVAVTGTNGKSTTSELLGAILRCAGRDVVVAGNIGTPLASVRAAAWVVCEVSSFQLEDVHDFACAVAVLLNLEPDHLDRHRSFEAYRAAKLRIFERAGVAIVPRGLGLEGIEFAPDDPLPAEPRMRGLHNRANAAAATAAARALGVDDEAIAAALRAFPGIPHRLEPIGEVGGVRYVNDSKATNVAAALRALAAYADEPVHLILGGSLKGESFEPLARAIGDNVRSIHLVGEVAASLALALRGREASGDRTLAAALRRAAAQASAGEVVLLSPACASYDQYENFERRGEEFRELVAELARARSLRGDDTLPARGGAP
jgi:UDP-N-acetylmuramoylalanine--D-glutamate ligase